MACLFFNFLLLLSFLSFSFLLTFWTAKFHVVVCLLIPFFILSANIQYMLAHNNTNKHTHTAIWKFNKIKSRAVTLYAVMDLITQYKFQLNRILNHLQTQSTLIEIGIKQHRKKQQEEKNGKKCFWAHGLLVVLSTTAFRMRVKNVEDAVLSYFADAMHCFLSLGLPFSPL